MAALLPFLLAGSLPLDEQATEHWCWSGAFIYPVGQRYDLEQGRADGTPGYHVNRGLVAGGPGHRRHQGADLANGRGGDPVRAASFGLVVQAENRGANGGYGSNVVLAHRTDDGRIYFTVYAHLRPGSVRLRAGDPVRPGQDLGLVGRSGRATTEHLHFEVREARRPGRPWEFARVLDPLEFVALRLPRHRSDTTWARPWLEWAEDAAVIAPETRGDSRLVHATWWNMLAHAVRLPLDRLPSDADSLAAVLQGAGVLPDEAPGAASEAVRWAEVARDLEIAARRGLRPRRGPEPGPEQRRRCREQVGLASPGEHPDRLARHHGAPPTVATACLLLADLLPPEEAASPPDSSAGR